MIFNKIIRENREQKTESEREEKKNSERQQKAKLLTHSVSGAISCKSAGERDLPQQCYYFQIK